VSWKYLIGVMEIFDGCPGDTGTVSWRYFNGCPWGIRCVCWRYL